MTHQNPKSASLLLLGTADAYMFVSSGDDYFLFDWLHLAAAWPNQASPLNAEGGLVKARQPSLLGMGSEGGDSFCFLLSPLVLTPRPRT